MLSHKKLNPTINQCLCATWWFIYPIKWWSIATGILSLHHINSTLQTESIKGNNSLFLNCFKTIFQSFYKYFTWNPLTNYYSMNSLDSFSYIGCFYHKCFGQDALWPSSNMSDPDIIEYNIVLICQEEHSLQIYILKSQVHAGNLQASMYTIILYGRL